MKALYFYATFSTQSFNTRNIKTRYIEGNNLKNVTYIVLNTNNDNFLIFTRTLFNNNNFLNHTYKIRKNMNKNKILSVISLTLFIIACSKPLPIDKANFIGDWKNDDRQVSLIITPEGHVEYSNRQPGKSTSISASIQDFKDDHFNVGLWPLSTKFKVSQPPIQDEQGNWHTTVNGYELSKTH